jgi:uncharacterized protein YjbJ (UPF0337 family)
MSESKKDDAVGRIKQAAGVLKGDKDLQREGRADQAGAKVKSNAEKARDAVDHAVDKVKEKFER